MPGEQIRLPGPSDRIAIVGRTGTGKTVAAIWHLSESDIDERPWVILNFKNDKIINRIEQAHRIGFDEVPDEPGVYIINVTPHNAKDLTDWFRRVWEHENIGVLIDEGYRIDQRDEWFNACLTQGRSKQISMIVLSQRPAWMSRFVLSEATFIQVFDLSHDEDIDKVRGYIQTDDGKDELDQALPPFHSFYYDVGRKQLNVFGPVPNEEAILTVIDARLFALEFELEDRPRRRPL
jgi:hypothetical protein